MVVQNTGRYRLVEDLQVRNSISIATLPRGTVLDITHIDTRFHKVLDRGLLLMDWTYWNLPVKFVEEVTLP